MRPPAGVHGDDGARPLGWRHGDHQRAGRAAAHLHGYGCWHRFRLGFGADLDGLAPFVGFVQEGHVLHHDVAGDAGEPFAAHLPEPAFQLARRQAGASADDDKIALQTPCPHRRSREGPGAPFIGWAKEFQRRHRRHQLGGRGHHERMLRVHRGHHRRSFAIHGFRIHAKAGQGDARRGQALRHLRREAAGRVVQRACTWREATGPPSHQQEQTTSEHHEVVHAHAFSAPSAASCSRAAATARRIADGA
jgi:hypothetical protein